MFHVNDLLVEIMRKVLASLDIPDGASGVDDGAPYALDGLQVPKRSSLQQETLESATLVCRSWSKIAQCILFQKIEVCYSAEPLLAVLETRSDLAASVEILAINPYAVDPFDGFAENLVSIPALLRLLPNLRKYSFQLLTQDMQTRHEYFPTSSHNGRLQYFGSSRFGSYSQVSEVELSKEAEQAYLNLSQSLRRLDLRSVRFGATKLPCLKNLETLCIDGDTFKSLSCQVVEDCPNLKAFYLTYPLDISDGAVFSVFVCRGQAASFLAQYLSQSQASRFIGLGKKQIRRKSSERSPQATQSLDLDLLECRWTRKSPHSVASNVHALLLARVGVRSGNLQ